VPELPDVESYRRFFARHALGRTVRQVVVPDPTILRNCTPQALGDALRGHRLGEPERIGKWLVGWADGPALLLFWRHFGCNCGVARGRRQVGRRARMLLGPAPATNLAAVSADTLVAGGDRHWFHRADCLLARTRNWAAASRSEHERAGRQPCPACNP